MGDSETDAPIPTDYDASDGWDDQNGLEKCPHCGKQYGGQSGHFGAVYTQGGRKFDHFTDTDPGDGPFFCPECWPELQANQRAIENRSLEDFA